MPHTIDLPPSAISSLGIIPRSQGGASAQDLKVAVRRSQLARLAREGMHASHAAAVVGVSPETARKDYRDPAFQSQVLRGMDAVYALTDSNFAERRTRLHELIQAQSYRSFEDLVGMLEDDSLPKSLRVKINQDFLDRNPETTQIQTVHHLSFDPAKLATAAKAALEMDTKIINIKADQPPGGLTTGDE